MNKKENDDIILMLLQTSLKDKELEAQKRVLSKGTCLVPQCSQGNAGIGVATVPKNHKFQGWMPSIAPLPGCPAGLEYLMQVDQLLVHQQVELLEAFTGFETSNKYEIKNSLGQVMYFAMEDSDCCTRNCCGPERPFDMRILDNSQREVIHLERPLRCSSSCCICCLQEITIFSPPGCVIGGVKQECDLCYPKFEVCNEQGECVLKIEGPCVTCNFCNDVEFLVLTLTGQVIGKISKQWSGLVKEYFTDADMFGIQFPIDLDVKTKACLLGAVFLIDFMFFEKTSNENERLGVWQQ